jgi:hypothetical protein
MQLAYEVKVLWFPPCFFKKEFLAINPLGTIPFVKMTTPPWRSRVVSAIIELKNIINNNFASNHCAALQQIRAAGTPFASSRRALYYLVC